MLEMTDTAREEIEKYFADKEKAPIRIFLASGCSGASLALALDEPNDTDEQGEVNGITFVMDKELYDQAKPLTLDIGPMGFQVLSSLELPSGGSCSGGCSGCSC
ncbi:MAG: IscA/HesB family protein [Desulfovibrio sp.]|uniref:IscA/HesB family protein n=1 Tax=Desulfovibrio sp. 7SRBS1 TaxID=3378064 RepID=UPI003B3E012D